MYASIKMLYIPLWSKGERRTDEMVLLNVLSSNRNMLRELK